MAVFAQFKRNNKRTAIKIIFPVVVGAAALVAACKNRSPSTDANSNVKDAGSGTISVSCKCQKTDPYLGKVSLAITRDVDANSAFDDIVKNVSASCKSTNGSDIYVAEDCKFDSPPAGPKKVACDCTKSDPFAGKIRLALSREKDPSSTLNSIIAEMRDTCGELYQGKYEAEGCHFE